ncbi:hypothetical protein L1049_011283 [Liquidambar formosana]|uniref:Uncharacterized protein n=1 Tax=Liquidambar formosana TaxID=63359 RepID=A0AAP0RXI4_LIQFO
MHNQKLNWSESTRHDSVSSDRVMNFVKGSAEQKMNFLGAAHGQAVRSGNSRDDDVNGKTFLDYSRSVDLSRMRDILDVWASVDGIGSPTSWFIRLGLDLDFVIFVTKYTTNKYWTEPLNPELDLGYVTLVTFLGTQFKWIGP